MSVENQENFKRAALVIIGNEILSGRTLDANTQFIALALGEHGVPLREVRVVPDVEAKVVEAVNAMRAEYDYVFTTGGIGPTHDDITAACVAKAFGLEFERHEGAYQALVEYYTAQGDEVTDARARMAMMPRGARLIANSVSGAPGFIVENVHVMAGVPRIMQGMLAEVLKEIPEGQKILSNNIICDLVESAVADGLGVIQAQHMDVDIGSYPYARRGVHGVSLVLRSVNEKALRDATAKVLSLVREKGGEPKGLGLQVELD